MSSIMGSQGLATTLLFVLRRNNIWVTSIMKAYFMNAEMKMKIFFIDVLMKNILAVESQF